MRRYIMEREIQSAEGVSEEALEEISKGSFEGCGGSDCRIEWIHSYVTDGKVYSVYMAPDEESVREHGRHGRLPVTRISEVTRTFDSVPMEL